MAESTSAAPTSWHVSIRRGRPKEIDRVTVDKIYLIGFMAAGKTTVGQQLAHRLGWRFEDIDDLIERRERATIAEIFSRHGEPYFRQAEREILQLLVPIRHVVFATGGGTFADDKNRAIINRDGASVWLDVPLQDIVDRLPIHAQRPLVTERSALEQLYRARADSYRQAHVRIAAGQLPPPAVVDRIAEAVN